MGAAVERTTSSVEDPEPRVKIPRPIEGGSYFVQDLGSWIDWLVGGPRLRRRAAEALEPLLMSEAEMAEMTPDPEPVEIPGPVPGGSEPITKGYDPPSETR